VYKRQALNRAWKLIKKHGVDKAVAFDISWKMERNELPKTKSKLGNPIIRYLDPEVKTTMDALLIKAEKYERLSSSDGMTMANYRSPKQRAGYKSMSRKHYNRLLDLMKLNNIGSSMYDLNDPEVQVVVGY